MTIAQRVALALALVLLAGLVILPGLVDWNRYKPAAEAYLERTLGRDVTIGGDLGARLLPRPRLTLAGVSVAGAPGGRVERLASIASLEAELALWPLLTGQIRVRSLVLVEPAIEHELLADGRSSLPRLAVSPRIGRVERAALWPDLAPPRWALERIEVVSGRIRHDAGPGGWSEGADDVDALVEWGPAGIRARVGGAWRARRLALDVELGPAAEAGRRSLDAVLREPGAGLEATLKGRVETSTDKAWRIGGRLALRAQAAAAGAPPLTIDGALSASPTAWTLADARTTLGDFTGRLGLALTPSPAPRLDARLDGHLLNLDLVRPVPATSAPGARYWPLALLAPAVSEAPAGVAGAPEGPPGFLTALTGTLDVKLAGLAWRGGLSRDVSVALALAPGAVTIREARAVLPGEAALLATGTWRPGPASGFSGQIALTGRRARDLLAWGGVAVEGTEPRRLMAFAFQSAIETAPGRLRLSDLKAALDGGNAAGSLSLDLGTRPRLDAVIAGSHIHLDRLVALLPAGASPAEPDAWSRLLSLAEALDGRLDLDLAGVTIGGEALHRVRLDARLDQGALRLEQLAVEAFRGGRLVLAGEGARLSGAADLALQGRFRAEDPAAALAAWVPALPARPRGLGAADLAVSASLKAGTGQVRIEGPLADGTLDARLDLSEAEAPLLNRIGLGRERLTVAFDAGDARALGRLLGLAQGRALAPVRAVPATLAFSRLDAAGEGALRVTAAVGGAALTLTTERKGAGAGARYAGALSVRADDAPGLLDALGLPASARDALGARVEIGLDAAGPAQAVVLRPLGIDLGHGKLSGEGHLDLTGERPRLALALQADTLDLDRIAPLWTAGYPPPAQRPPWSTRPLSGEPLALLDGTLALDAGAVRLRGLALSDVTLAAALAQGSLTLGDLRGKLFGGPFSGTAVLRGGVGEPAFSLSLTVIEADGAALSAALWGRPILAGPLAGALSLAAEGLSPRALAGASRGTIALQSAAGTLFGLAAGGAPEGPTAFTALALEADIAAGQGRLRRGGFTTADGPAALGGGFSLDTWTMALVLDRPRGPTLPASRLRLDGPIDAPRREVETAAPGQQAAPPGAP